MMTPDDEAALEALRKAHRELAARVADGIRPDPPPVIVLILDETGWICRDSPARQLLADLAALGRSENILVSLPREGP